MASERDIRPERKSSTVSTSSVSHRPGTVRSRSRKQSLVTPNSAKSLVSFPSLSPEESPGPKVVGSFNTSPVAGTDSFPHGPRRDSAAPPSIVQTLIQRSASSRGRTALFDDSPRATANEIPGSLHYASDEHIQHHIARIGAVALVRRLAEDLAQRDAEITSMRRRAEEREKELKMMLQEVEVSNVDIESRLRRVGNLMGNPVRRQNSTVKAWPWASEENSKAGHTNGIDQMMGEAMQDHVGAPFELDEGYLDSLDIKDKDATIKAGNIVQQGNERRSTTSSLDSQSRTASTVRGWKDYLWNGNGLSGKTSRTSSIIGDNTEEAEATLNLQGQGGANGRRKALDEDLFSPLQRASTTQSTSNVGDKSRKASSSVASWTMKLFAGNTQAGRNPSSNTARGRSATTGSGAPTNSRATSSASVQTASSAKAALMKVNTTGSDNRIVKKNIPPLPLRTNAAPKATQQPTAVQHPGSPKSTDTSANLGPVEMDTILPLDARPPTDQTYNNTSAEFLTDRFGFIYDQRRRKREVEKLRTSNVKAKRSSGIESLTSDRASMHSRTDSVQRPDTPASTDDRADEKPTKRWQDYLKVATFPTELLSHTPSAKPTTTVISAETPIPLKRSPTFGEVRGSLPATSLNPEPATSPITASNAEISTPSTSATSIQADSLTTDVEPVKLLLAQLTEIHDSLQHERTVKWNEFLRKVRAERARSGEVLSASSTTKQAATMPEVALTDGEMIGVAGLGNKGKVGRAKWKEFKSFVLSGIPVIYRAKIWAECSGASALRVPGYYDELVSHAGRDDPEIEMQIQMDIHRTMTDNIYFRSGPGVGKLHEVLLAYSRRNPEVGYCQGMNLITASLLLIMPTAEDAFWLLTSIIENILPPGYYSSTLLASRADQLVLRHYVARLLPRLSTHLDNLGIDLEALTFQWFLSVFTACLSAEALFRVWDVVLCLNDGSTFLFQVALALLKLNEGRLLEEESAGGVYDRLGGVSDHEVGIDGLIRASEALKGEVRREEVEELRVSALHEEAKRVGGGGGNTDERDGGRSRSTSGGLELQVPMPVEE
ncbi:MAG: hypothetical protein Q9191_002926 [Dirinaria sp. TL-2023a]